MDEQPLRVGVVGLGVRGQHAYHQALAAQPGVRLMRLAPHPASSPVILEGHGQAFFEEEAKRCNATLCRDPEEVITAKDVDIVCVLVEPSLAFDVIRRCAEAGKHIFRDKPMVLTAGEANRVVEAVERAGVRMAVGWGAFRFNPPYGELRAKVAEGAIGEVVAATFLMPWGGGPLAGFTCSKDHHDRYGGGEVHNFAGYALAYLRWLLGAERPIRRVWAQMAAFFYPDYVAAGNEDLASLSFEFDGGPVASVVTGRLPAACGEVCELAVVGTRGTLRLSGYTSASRLVAGAPSRVDYGQSGMGPLAADFVRAIREGRRPAIDHREGRAIHLALLAAYESARAGRAVELPPL